MGSAQTKPSRIIKVQEGCAADFTRRYSSLEDYDTQNIKTLNRQVNISEDNTVNMEQDTNEITVKDDALNKALPTESDGKGTDDLKPDKDKAEAKEDESDNDDEVSTTKTKKAAKKELTPEEFEEAKNNHFIGFQELIKSAKDRESYQEEEGEFTSEVKATVMKMYRLYFVLEKLKKVPLAEIVEWRLKVASMAIETDTVSILCDIVIKTYPSMWLKEDGHLNYLLKFTVLTLLNFSDASTDFAVKVANYPELCEKVKEMLEDSLEEHINKTQSVSKEKMTQWLLSLLHNLSMAESNIGRLREVEFIPLLVSYLATPKEMIRLNVFATLAGIINEKESEIIQANIELVTFLLKVLSKGMSTRLHRHNGWSCKECTLTVRMLARNDANKKLLVEQGALVLLVKLARIGSPDEQYEAVSGLWALAFDEDNKEKICNDGELGVVDILHELTSSEDRRVKKVCDGAMWTLRDSLKTSEVKKYKDLAQEESTARRARAKSAKKPAGHVMISYQWGDQKTLMIVRDRLKASGIQVWMDIDQMGGSTLESMANAVEQAKIILMCMSQKYKNSPNCRAEAEYAFQRHKAIVPLKMERGYVPDGWLGFICGAKLFFDFSGKYSFDDKMDQLLKEITTIYNRQNAGVAPSEDPIKPVTVAPVTGPKRDTVDSGTRVVPVAPSTHQPVAMTKLKTIRAWTSTDVSNWINKNDLKSCGVGNTTGGEVAMLLMMYQRAPESFFKCLENTLKIRDFKSMSKLVWALSDLAEES